MMIEALISMMRYLSAREDDDVADRLNYLYTCVSIFAFLCSLQLARTRARIFQAKYFAHIFRSYQLQTIWRTSSR